MFPVNVPINFRHPDGVVTKIVKIRPSFCILAPAELTLCNIEFFIEKEQRWVELGAPYESMVHRHYKDPVNWKKARKYALAKAISIFPKNVRKEIWDAYRNVTQIRVQQDASQQKARHVSLSTLPPSKLDKLPPDPNTGIDFC